MFALSKKFGTAAAGGAMRAGFRAMSSIAVEFPNHFKGHRFDAPPNEATTTKEELMDYFRQMYVMRRMEITCDTEYKARNIRGFCHLYDGQEAIAVGVNTGLTVEDSWITSYRCHCTALARGSSVEQVFAELFGFREGTSKGKGGSMHFYSKEHNFYGGAGIVGAQVPLGAGLAFAGKYNTPDGQDSPVAIACFGDGAANQGQIWESANMASLWKLPLVLCIENNQYGMGTSIERSSSNNEYYTMGNQIPGLWIDGMNVLAVREGMKAVKAHCASGKGPMYVEMSTYRYHGHSMSDPGITYRDRDEIQKYRKTRDPIEFVKKTLTESGSATEAELKEIEKELRVEVQEALKRAKAGSPPPLEWLTTDIYEKEMPPFVRMPNTDNNQYH